MGAFYFALSTNFYEKQEKVRLFVRLRQQNSTKRILAMEEIMRKKFSKNKKYFLKELNRLALLILKSYHEQLRSTKI